jgi:hypothetical protein
MKKMLLVRKKEAEQPPTTVHRLKKTSLAQPDFLPVQGGDEGPTWQRSAPKPRASSRVSPNSELSTSRRKCL